MEPIFDSARRLQRMRNECADSAGQALLMAVALTVLIVVIGLSSALV